jgi:hypothetical protein
VQVDAGGVYLRVLIVQLKIVPLPVFLESADEDATRAVMISLGIASATTPPPTYSTRTWIPEITGSAAMAGCSCSTTTPSKS